MAEPRKIAQGQYDALRAKMEDRYGYDQMSDADKAQFNRIFDQTVVVDDQTDDHDR